VHDDCWPTFQLSVLFLVQRRQGSVMTTAGETLEFWDALLPRFYWLRCFLLVSFLTWFANLKDLCFG
jgi:hypothetical protein